MFQLESLFFLDACRGTGLLRALAMTGGGAVWLGGGICTSEKRNHGRWSARIKRMDAILSEKEVYMPTPSHTASHLISADE